MLLTRPPLGSGRCKHLPVLVQLACVKHAASVRPEPGSNSPYENCLTSSLDAAVNAANVRNLRSEPIDPLSGSRHRDVVLSGYGPAFSLETLIFKKPYLCALQELIEASFEQIAAASVPADSLRRS